MIKADLGWPLIGLGLLNLLLFGFMTTIHLILFVEAGESNWVAHGLFLISCVDTFLILLGGLLLVFSKNQE